jgi:hypothetical protein
MRGDYQVLGNEPALAEKQRTEQQRNHRNQRKQQRLGQDGSLLVVTSFQIRKRNIFPLQLPVYLSRGISAIEIITMKLNRERRRKGIELNVGRSGQRQSVQQCQGNEINNADEHKEPQWADQAHTTPSQIIHGQQSGPAHQQPSASQQLGIQMRQRIEQFLEVMTAGEGVQCGALFPTLWAKTLDDDSPAGGAN